MAASEHIFFELDEVATEGRKTAVWKVKAHRDYATLGTIKWYGPWRQYAFWPEPGTVWNPDCLDAVDAKLRVLMEDRRREAA